MNKKYFIHISDAHISKDNLVITEEMCGALIKDIKNITHDGDICLILFSGDLVFSGIEDNLNLALEKFIIPILSELNISEDRFIYVPGNHEIDISKVDPDFNKAFTERILVEGVNYSDFIKPNIIYRLEEFFKTNKQFCNWEQKNPVYTFKASSDSLNIGVTLINTAWNSSGDSKYESKKIIIHRDSLLKSLSSLEDSNIKIAIMHHPIDWLDDDNAASIEAILNKYDFVVCGHKHHSRSSSELYLNGNTIINVASEIEISNQENGYSIIALDSLKLNEVKIYNRTYNKRRLEYVPNVDFNDEGVVCYHKSLELLGDKQLLIDIALNSRKNFYNNLDDLFIINLLDKSKKRKFNELFVMPKLSRHSELVKERHDDPDEKEIEILEELLKNKHLTFWGKKEAGKTTLANYIGKLFYDNIHKLKKLPIIIDCKFLDTYKSVLLNAIHHYLVNILDDNQGITQAQIELLAKNGDFAIILDNYEISDKTKRIVEYFDSNYPDNQFIFMRNESARLFSEEDKALFVGETTVSSDSNIFIRNMDKHNIRLLAKNIASINPSIEDEYVDKIVHSFSTNNIPRTPFAVSLILSICSEAADYTPTNQAKIVENFMEQLLEKLNPEEIYSKSYDFSNKEIFLSTLAQKMYLDNCFYMDEDSFLQFVKNYHTKKGYSLKDSKFDTIFFEKGILININGFVFFRYECLIHYYLAKYCLKNTDFLNNEILTESNYLNNLEVLNYYTGLNREDSNVLQKINSYLTPYIESNSEFGDLFELDSIKIELNIDSTDIEQKIKSTKKLNTIEKDKLTDVPDNSNNYNPELMTREKTYSDRFAFISGLDIFGSIIRNSEELDIDIKREAFSLYIKGCLVVWKDLREQLLDFSKEINEYILSHAIEGQSNVEEIRDKLNYAFEKFTDLVKIAVPLTLSGLIFNSIGTEKLKTVINEEYEKFDFNSPEKLLLNMLLSDLKDEKWYQTISQYIRGTKKKDFLWVMYFKCQYYYQFDYFNKLTDKIIEPFAECILSLKNANKNAKSNIIQGLKDQKKLSP